MNGLRYYANFDGTRLIDIFYRQCDEYDFNTPLSFYGDIDHTKKMINMAIRNAGGLSYYADCEEPKINIRHFYRIQNYMSNFHYLIFRYDRRPKKNS